MAKKPNIKISKISKLSGSDLHELCDAAEAAIEEGGGFGWLTPPPRRVLETLYAIYCSSADDTTGPADGH